VSDDVVDAIVIGGGPAGLDAAARIVRGGLTVALVERRLVGGECNFYGCIPSKALLWPMELARRTVSRPAYARPLRGIPPGMHGAAEGSYDPQPRADGSGVAQGKA
jgi:pyruvate/2-oxoglutarate dehydrogenase complex dihydrolipoamide dehydrogenase (E3) component